MMEWDSRMKNTHTVQVLKAAIPFLDVSVGERIDLEGLLGAVRPFAAGRERRILDMFLQFFQMRHMMDMMQLMQSMQQAQEMAGETEGAQADPFSMLKAMMPADQQDTLDMVSAMMSMMQDGSPDPPEEQAEENGGNDESVNL